MKRSCLITGAVLLVLAGPVRGQGLHLTPLVGAFHPESGVHELDDIAGEGRLLKGNALAVGLNAEFSIFRASFAYATGATITGDGVANGDDIGDGSLLAVTGGVVLRPLPRVAVLQPYITGGLGLKREVYSFENTGFSNLLPENETEFGWHFAIGADLMFGGLGLAAEVSDVITGGEDELFGRHDMFIMAGLRLRLF
jgi:hypothetical protein